MKILLLFRNWKNQGRSNPLPGGGTSIYPATDCAAQEGMLFSDLAVSERVSYLHYMSQVSEGVSNLRLLGYLVSQRVSKEISPPPV